MAALRSLIENRRRHARRRLIEVLEKADRPMSFYELAVAARVRSPFVLRTLDRWMHDGIVTDSWSEPGPKGHRRRFYRLAGDA